MKEKKKPISLPKLSRFDLRMHLGVLMLDERFRGDVIILAISLEAALDNFLSGYFSYTAKKSEFDKVVLSKLTFSQKISVFKELGFSPRLKSFPQLTCIFSGLNRLRNHAAHASWGEGDKIYKLADNEFVREFISGYPSSIDGTRTRVVRSLAALRRSSDYRLNDYYVDPDAEIPF